MPAPNTTLLVQSLIAASGSSRQAAAMLGISRDTVHKLRDGGTVKADVVAKIERNYRQGIHASDPKVRQGWTLAALKQGNAKKPDASVGMRMIKARTNTARDVLSRYKEKNRANAVKQAISKEGRAEWEQKQQKARDRFRARVAKAQREGKATPQSAFGSP